MEIDLDEQHQRKLISLADDNEMTPSEAIAMLLDYHADYLIGEA